MRREDNIFKNVDWALIGLYLLLVVMGWLNIYASVFNEEHQSITDLTQKYGKQLIWIVSSLIIAFTIFLLDEKFYTAFAYPIYVLSMISLVLVLFFGHEVSGSKSR